MGVLVKTSLFICILWGIHIWIKQVIDTEENNQKMEETLENMNHSYVEFQGKINQARKYRHDIPKHLHMMEQAVSDIIDDEYSVDTMLNAIACVTEEKCQEYNIQININLAIKEREIFDKLNIEKVDLSGLLQNLLDNSNIPVITAFLLGLLTAISPCPLATNITAIGFISKDIGNRNKIFLGGLLYTLGRVVAYTVLGIILISILKEGSSMFSLQKGISKYGEILIAPVLIFVGVFMLFGDHLNLPKFGFSGTGKAEKLKGNLGSLLLGVLFALAFCPTSGLFYFGMLIPMSAAEPGGYLLPIVYAVATGLPVILVAWILAYSVAGIGKFYNRIQVFQKWFNRVVAVLFIAVGIYYAYINYL